QKLAILAAWGNEPDLLILDEPVSALDPVARREFLRSLLDLASDSERTVLFSTHITSDIERVASHVAMLIDGRIGWFDELDDMKERVMRWRVRGADVLGDVLAAPGIIGGSVEGTFATLVAVDADEPARRDFERRFNAQVDVESLGLEDMFLELHGGGCSQ
ncbi:MAG: ABC transporter ATP-binding protein, partial [Planctomycetales bacterium]|nr:ABC transporter ATP-binding protein [Planctomycetales bacterium]